LIRYYRYLAELTARQSVDTITSAQLGRVLDVDASQVRKDFAAIGLAGVSRVGYDVCEVCRTIRTVLGFDEKYSAVLIGTGHLGGAILNYGGFERYGLRIVAAFDADPRKIGREEGGLTIQSVHDLRAYVQNHQVPVAILTTPSEVAQGLADLLVLAGIRSIWNFSPTRISVPPDVLIRNEHISLGLAEISFHLRINDVTRPETPGKQAACCDGTPEPAATETDE
jgi:redox-sensing transcriptional repressor